MRHGGAKVGPVMTACGAHCYRTFTSLRSSELRGFSRSCCVSRRFHFVTSLHLASRVAYASNHRGRGRALEPTTRAPDEKIGRAYRMDLLYEVVLVPPYEYEYIILVLVNT